MKILIAALAAAAALIGAAPAQADSSDFLDRVQDLGWYDNRGDAYLLDNGYLVCRLLARGYDGNDVARGIYRNTGLDVTAADAIGFVIIAVEELCPQFDHRRQAA